ncbi:MAG: response regulator transcription factor [Thermoguttaceae bacterium]
MKNFNLLFVTADDDFGAPMQTALEEEGFVVRTATGVETAQTEAQSRQCDIAIIDLKLERPDGGFTLCHHLKKDNPKLPIILLSDANSKMGTDFSLHAAADRNWINADALLQKPVRFEQLLYESQRLLGLPTTAQAHH